MATKILPQEMKFEIDSYFKLHKELRDELLFGCKFNKRVAKIARMAYDTFDASSPKEAELIIDYIWTNHIPPMYHDNFL